MDKYRHQTAVLSTRSLARAASKERRRAWASGCGKGEEVQQEETCGPVGLPALPGIWSLQLTVPVLLHQQELESKLWGGLTVLTEWRWQHSKVHTVVAEGEAKPAGTSSNPQTSSLGRYLFRPFVHFHWLDAFSLSSHRSFSCVLIHRSCGHLPGTRGSCFQTQENTLTSCGHLPAHIC